MVILKRSLIDILCCPLCKHSPLQLCVFEEKGNDIVTGAIMCTKCLRFYPILDEIPQMLPDELRDLYMDLEFLKRWKEKFPKEILQRGKPVNLGV